MNRLGVAVIPSDQSHPAPEYHPERSARLLPAIAALETEPMQSRITILPKREYPVELLKKIHAGSHIDLLQQYNQPGMDYLDPDTYRTGSSFAASCEVTWALLTGVDAAFAGEPYRSFVIGRPPGHHAETGQSMGFCLVNHVAVAAQYAFDTHPCRRVAIVDFDVHHGNGTQEIFYDRNDVLYISTHQYPFYPGSGSTEERGRGAGEGFTSNYPLVAGTGDDELKALFEGDIKHELGRFHPDLILVSAGFDGHRLDPLGGFVLSGEGYGAIAECLRSMADELCEGRLVSLMEGGYDPRGNVDAVENYIRGLTDK